MPIQMYTMITETSDHWGEVSQLTGAMPNDRNTEFTTPESLLSVQDHVDADTINGSSHGTRNSARNVADSRKCRVKNTASAIPTVNWNASDTRVNTMVCTRAGTKTGSCSTVL